MYYASLPVVDRCAPAVTTGVNGAARVCSSRRVHLRHVKIRDRYQVCPTRFAIRHKDKVRRVRRVKVCCAGLPVVERRKDAKLRFAADVNGAARVCSSGCIHSHWWRV
jgi:hypothetical protein